MERFDFGIHFEMPDLLNSTVRKVAIVQEEMISNALIDEVIKIAIEQGFTDLYVLDKRKIINALSKQMPSRPVERDLWELGTASGYMCPE